MTITIGVATTPEDRGAAGRCLDEYDEGCGVGNCLTAVVDHTPVTSLTVEE